MSDEPKAVLKRFLEAFWAQDYAAAKACLAPHAQWWFAQSLPYPRPCPAADAIDLIARDMMTAFDPDDGLKVQWEILFGEGKEVAAEYSARGRAHNGKPYENRYCMRATVEHGKLVSLRPFTDTKYLTEVLLG
jgi:ketosteroid isomerase-like protein